MEPVPAIGIDLGTTFSLAAVYRNGISEIIPNKDGDKLTPSQIFYHPDSAEVSIGTIAEELSLDKIENYVFDIKRIIGREYQDAYVQQLRSSDQYRYHIVAADDDDDDDKRAAVRLYQNNKQVRKSPEEICAELLKYIKDCATEYLGDAVTEAVISVPAYFSNAQRKATKTAAELAGLKVLTFISEPVAAAIHYAEDKLNFACKLLVFDLGGGTLDVSIIDVNDKTFKVDSVQGDTYLGGRDVDELLFKHFKGLLSEQFGEQIFNETLTRRIVEKCISLKKRLSMRPLYSIPIDSFGGNENNKAVLRMTRTELERKCTNLFDRCLALVKQCLVDSNLTAKDIDRVILVGGSTRIPKIREMLTSYFGNEKIRTDLNPDEAVAHGAATQAAALKQSMKNFEKYRISEITPLSLGVGLDKGLVGVVIKKNSPIPISSVPYVMSTIENNQSTITFKIVEGERKNLKYCNILSKLTVFDLPPGRARKVCIEIIFSLDGDGILKVQSRTVSTGKIHELTVNLENFRLSDGKVRHIIEDAEKNKKDDEVFETFVRYIWKVTNKAQHVLYDLSKIPLTTDRMLVKEKCELFIACRDTFEYTEMDNVIKAYNVFKNSIENYVSPYIDCSL